MGLQEICRPIQNELDQFEIELRTTLSSDNALIDSVVSHLATHRGKRIRPILLLLSCGLHNGDPKNSLPAAVAVELLHTATLLHDDVVDMSDTRRGAPTVNGLWSNRISVLIGDFLFSRVLSITANLPDRKNLDIICSTTDQMSRGELLQEEHSYDTEVDEHLYLRLISEKTASLFAASCQLGALAAGARAGALGAMAEFGTNLGISFQIRDDLLDYLGAESTLGKPTGKDIQNHKITLPLIHSLRSAEPEAAATILSLLKNPSAAGLKEIIDFCRQRGGIAYAEEYAHAFNERALTIIATYPPSSYRESLMELMDFVISRQI